MMIGFIVGSLTMLLGVLVGWSACNVAYKSAKETLNK